GKKLGLSINTETANDNFRFLTLLSSLDELGITYDGKKLLEIYFDKEEKIDDNIYAFPMISENEVEVLKKKIDEEGDIVPKEGLISVKEFRKLVFNYTDFDEWAKSIKQHLLNAA
ncbi:MAG: hypothetical protein N3G74_02740, partial [Candidatus Micrarchaeota archaeon]|nr:hypothetical protein [Candidatus Micrarchaeota archaeon]